MLDATEHDRLHTAYHESGHAIAAWELDIQCGGISIVSDGVTAGRIGVEGDDGFYIQPGSDAYSPENNRQYRIWAFAQAVIDYSSHAACVALLGIGDMSFQSARVHGAANDFRKAAERLGKNARLIKKAKARALEIVRRRSDAIKVLAEAVLKRGTLSASVMQVLHGWFDTPNLMREVLSRADAFANDHSVTEHGGYDYAVFLASASVSHEQGKAGPEEIA